MGLNRGRLLSKLRISFLNFKNESRFNGSDLWFELFLFVNNGRKKGIFEDISSTIKTFNFI